MCVNQRLDFGKPEARTTGSEFDGRQLAFPAPLVKRGGADLTKVSRIFGFDERAGCCRNAIVKSAIKNFHNKGTERRHRAFAVVHATLRKTLRPLG